MKKFLNINLVFTFLLTAFAGIAGLGDPPPIPVVDPIKNDGTGGDEVVIYYPDPENCSATTITLGVILANLRPTGFDDEGPTYGLPVGYPAMFLEYSIGDGPVDRIPLVDAHELEVRNNIQLYQFSVPSYPIDFTALCQEQPLSRDNTFDLDYSLRVVRQSTAESSQYEEYRACDYTSECDIYSCLVFQASGGCDTTDDSGLPECLVDPLDSYFPAGEYYSEFYPECDQTALTSNPGKITVSCNTCRDDSPTGPGSGGENSDFGNNTDQSINNISIQPNPFKNEITINWSELETIKQLSLYDVNEN